MEKYLTPIQYEQYLHDKAYETAVANMSPSVGEVFILAGLFIVIMLIVFLICAMVDAYEDRDDEVSDEVREAQAAAKRRVRHRIADNGIRG